MLKSCLLKEDVKKIEKTVSHHKPLTVKEQEAIEEDPKIRISDRGGLSIKNDSYRIGDTWYKDNKKLSSSSADKLKKMGIPPGWDNVIISKDPHAKVQAVGQDVSGRWQYRYSQEHIDQKKQEKFDRVKLFSRDVPGIKKVVNDGVLREDVNAMLLRLEDKTAIRMGSETDTKAETQAYGLTTLRNEHVTVKGSTISLDFIAKKGIPAHYKIEDEVLSTWLKDRQKRHDGKLFPDTSPTKLNNYLQEASGGKNYTIKDFRTYKGTQIAYNNLKQYENVDLTRKEKKQVVKDVCEKVSEFLRNTPSMAKESYINPMVWEIIGGI